MQQWTDEGFIISVRKYGEQSAVVRVLTQAHGLQSGMLKGAFSKHNRGIVQPGNHVHVYWQARLEEHLGTVRCELLRSFAPELLSDSLSLTLFNTLATLISAIVPERMAEPTIYQHTCDLMHALPDHHAALVAYARFELTLLQAMGFGLDLETCAATNTKEKAELVYVSPKSGRAVSREAGLPYHTKMLALPAFFLNDGASADNKQLREALTLTGYFLEQRVFLPEGKPLPKLREEILSSVIV